MEEDTLPRTLQSVLGLFEGVRQEDLGSAPLLFFPEQETTNGQVALLQFAPLQLLQGATVQPIALKVLVKTNT